MGWRNQVPFLLSLNLQVVVPDSMYLDSSFHILYISRSSPLRTPGSEKMPTVYGNH
jgi:hypothetical protein